MMNRLSTSRVVVILACTVLVLSGCKLQLVAPYDESGFEEVLAVAKRVDLFYGRLLEAPEAERAYANWRKEYLEVEADMRSLWLRNAARDDNRDSEQIMQDILGEWTRYRARHLERDGYSNGNALLDRDRLARMFVSAAQAETAKRRGQ